MAGDPGPYIVIVSQSVGPRAPVTSGQQAHTGQSIGPRYGGQNTTKVEGDGGA